MSFTRRTDIAGILANEEMLGTALLTLLVDELGTEFFEWEPETLALEVKTRYGVELSQVNRDKIWSLVTALTTDLFYVSLESFIPTCNALNGSAADFNDYDPVTGEEAAWGIVEVSLLDPPEPKDDLAKRFSHDIRRYIGITLQSEGVTTPPLTLKPYAEFDQDPEASAGATLGPDADAYAMYSKRQAEARAEIEEYVQAKLDMLAAQLQALPLVNGVVRKQELTKRLAQARLAAAGQAA